MRVTRGTKVWQSVLLAAVLCICATAAFAAAPTFNVTSFGFDTSNLPPVNLTQECTIDWVQAGFIMTPTPALLQKNPALVPGGSSILTVTYPGTPTQGVNGFKYSWTDGTPPNAVGNFTGRFNLPAGGVVTATAKVDPTGANRTLRLYMRAPWTDSGYSSIITATVGSGTPVTFDTLTLPTTFDNTLVKIDIVYSSTKASDSLVVTVAPGPSGALQLGGAGVFGSPPVPTAKLFYNWGNIDPNNPAPGIPIVDLTAQGTLDWVQAGTPGPGAINPDPSVDTRTTLHKAGGVGLTLTCTATVSNNYAITTKWSDGAAPYAVEPGDNPVSAAQPTANVVNQWKIGGTNFVLTAPVDPTGRQRILKMWLRASNPATLIAQTGPGSPVDLFPTIGYGTSSTNGQWARVDVTYSSANPSDMFTVTFAPVTAGNALQFVCAALDTVPIAPVWKVNPFAMPSAAPGVAYAGSIASQVTDPDPVTFAKSSGPAWLTVGADGTLSGTPAAGDAGVNTFTIQANSRGLITEATMIINVTAPPAPGAPTVVYTSPLPGTLYTQTLPQNIVVVFDRPVTGVTTLNINGVVVSGVTLTGGTVATWPVPVSSWPDIPTPVTVTMTGAGITETLSGTSIPFGANYAWSFTYDKTQYHPAVQIALVSNNGTPADDHSAYTSFLLNDVYGTYLNHSLITVEDVPGKYYGLTPAQAATLQATMGLVIVLPYQTESGLSTKTNWNSLALPVMIHKAGTALDWGLGNGTGNVSNYRTDSWMAGHFGLTNPITQALITVNSVPDTSNPPTPDPIWTGMGANFWSTAFGTTGPGVAYWWPSQAAFQGIVVPNGVYTLPSATQPELYSPMGWGSPANSVQLMTKWELGNGFNGGGTAPARRFFYTMGAQVSNDNYGSTEVASYFNSSTGAINLGSKQALRNSLRWLFNPDAVPASLTLLTVTSTSPASGATAGVLGTVTVVFSEPVYGILPTDLTWNASTSAVTYQATTAVPLGGPAPNNTWTFDGPWESDAAIRVVFQPINITLNGLGGTISQSHIKAVNGDGLPVTNWTWNYVWIPVPASVPEKLWTLYE